VVHLLILGLLLSVVWWFLSGYTLTLILSLGALSVLLVLFLCWKMDKADGIRHPSEVIMPRVLTYYPWLLWEIVKANIDVARIILKPGMPIQPHIFSTIATQKSDVGQTIYANSITLTPGTVTVGVDDDHFEVHALTNEAADGVKSGDMDRRVSALEKRGRVRFDDYNAVDDQKTADKGAAS